MARRAAVLAVALVAVFAAPSVARAETEVTFVKTLERNVAKRIDLIRQAHGLKTFSRAPRLKKAGRAHVRNMGRHGYFEHWWYDGTPYGRWIRRFWPGPGYTGWSAGENLYWEGPVTDAKSVVRAWMGSAPHRAAILSKSWNKMGVGAVRADNPKGEYAGIGTAWIVALEFGSRSG
jgi:uncharacterized protein YkwD